jgi:hypothetical protein
MTEQEGHMFALYFGPRRLNRDDVEICRDSVLKLKELVDAWRNPSAKLKERISIVETMCRMYPSLPNWKAKELEDFGTILGVERLLSNLEPIWHGEIDGLHIFPLDNILGDGEYDRYEIAAIAVRNQPATSDAWVLMRWLKKLDLLKELGIASGEIEVTKAVKKRAESE